MRSSPIYVWILCSRPLFQPKLHYETSFIILVNNTFLKLLWKYEQVNVVLLNSSNFFSFLFLLSCWISGFKIHHAHDFNLFLISKFSFKISLVFTNFYTFMIKIIWLNPYHRYLQNYWHCTNRSSLQYTLEVTKLRDLSLSLLGGSHHEPLKDHGIDLRI